jgi:hypothetical protein
LAKTIKTKAQVNEERILDKTEYENELREKRIKIENLTNENFKLLKHIKQLEANNKGGSKKIADFQQNKQKNILMNNNIDNNNEFIEPMETDSYFSEEFKSTYEHIFSELEITKKQTKNYEEKIEIILKDLESSEKIQEEMRQKLSELNFINEELNRDIENKDTELIKYKNNSDNLLLFELENQKINSENLKKSKEEIEILHEKIININESLKKSYEICAEKQKEKDEEIFKKNQIKLTLQKFQYDLENKDKFLKEQQETIKNLQNKILQLNDFCKEKEIIEKEKNFQIEEFKSQIEEIKKKGSEIIKKFEDEIKKMNKEKDELLNEMSNVKCKLNQKIILLREKDEEKNKLENNFIELELKLANEENEKIAINEKIEKNEISKNELEKEINVLKNENYILCQNKNE